MKVTVCFGPVKIVVPCRDGQITVQELIEKSVARYRKATGKSEAYWIHVRSLASQGEGGILDTDDLVCDVADDREKLTAIYEEQDGPSAVSKYIGDGHSTCNSSVGTGSPIMMDNHINNSNNKYMNHSPYDDGEDSDEVVVVTGQEMFADSRLHVRRGSDPTMPHVNENGTVIDTNANTLPVPPKPSPFLRNSKLRSSRDDLDDHHQPFERNSSLRSSREDELTSAFQRFGRDSSRRSLASNNALKWAEAQEKIESKDKEIETSEIEIPNDGTPLGIHIIARVENDDGSAYGLVIHGIEDGGRAARDGRLRPGDHIKTINGINVTQETFDRAQEIMREAMKTPTVTVEIEREKVPPLVLPDPPPTPVEKTPPTPPPKFTAAVPVIPARSPTTVLSSNGPASPVAEKTNLIAPTNTRRIGRKLYIQLMKGPQGLGFSITTRDNPTLGKNPIYIKNILPKGAAIADGRLKQGDRLLEVNGIEMTGKNQTEAVSILRSVKLGGVVNLIVSRQESPTKELPRQLKMEANPTEDPTNAKNKQILTFNINLNDTGSAGLGVSVKGKTSGGADGEIKDLGIFIKSVIHGGAASKDGRLRPNDQLLCINDTSLLRMSNGEAMETLRRAMSGEKSPRSTIQLIIARRFDDQAETPTMPRARKSLSSPSSDKSVEVIGPYEYQDYEWDRTSIKTPDVEAQLEQADELLNHPLLNSHNTNSLIEGRNVASSMTSSSQSPPAPGVDSGEEERIKSPTLPQEGTEIVMIEDTDIDQHKSGLSSPRAPSPPRWLLNEWEKAQDGEMSPLPDPEKEFSRDNRARLSFSERRQGGSLDAKQMAWYKKTKEKREEKSVERDGRNPADMRDVAASTGSLVKSTSTENLAKNTNLSSIKDLTVEERRDIGPELGLKKSSSLESLQAAVAEVTTTEEFPGRPRPKVVRGRGCNESFRAAVDRSYDMPMNGDAPRSEEPGHSSSTHNQGPNGLPPSIAASDRSSVSSMDPSGMNRTNSKRKSKDKDKRKSGVFKGLGSMFRFGKHRKGADDMSPTEDEIRSHEVITADSGVHSDLLDRYQSQDDYHKHDNSRTHLREDQSNHDTLSRAERMQQLREQYQQQHRERRGKYVDDEDDDDLSGREVDRYGHQRPSPSPKMPREQRGSPQSLPDSKNHIYEGVSRRDDPRRDEPRREDHRREDYRRDNPRRDDYRRDDPRREDYRRDDPRREDYRRDDQRREDYRRDDPRRDDPRRVDPRRDRNDQDSRRERDPPTPEKPLSNGYGNDRERHEHERTSNEPQKRTEKVEVDDNGGFIEKDDGGFDRNDSYGRVDRRRDRRDERQDDERENKHRQDRSHDGRPRDHKYDDRLYEERHRQANHGDRYHDRHRDERNHDPKYRQDPYHDRGDRNYDRWNGRPDDRREDRRHRREDRSRDHLDRHEQSRDRLDQVDRPDEKTDKKDKSQKELDKEDEKQLKRRESERSIKSSKFNKRASDRSKSKNKDKDKEKEKESKKEESAPAKIEKKESRLSLRKKKDKKEKEEPEKKKDKTEAKNKEELPKEEPRNEERRDERHRRRDDPRDKPYDRGDYRGRPDDGRYDSRDPRDYRYSSSRDRHRGPPPPDRYGYQSLERNHHRRPRGEPPSKHYNTTPRDIGGNSSDSDRHSRRGGGERDAPHSNHYPNDQSERPYANGPSTSQQRYHDKPRGGGGGGYGDYRGGENDYYGNSSAYGSLRKHREERDYYGREHSQYEATARV